MVVATLTHLNKSGAKPLRVLFESVLANAKLKGVSADSLEINSLQVNKGPAMKRFRPVSRGMAHEYKKSMSHINLSLKTKEVVKVAVAKQEKKAPSEKKLNTN
jgi:large subunit ribosomal protein L22